MLVAFDGKRARLLKLLLQQPQPSQRIYCVHRTFERQMNIKVFEQQNCLFYNGCALPGRKFVVYYHLVELIQCFGVSKKWPDDRV